MTLRIHLISMLNIINDEHTQGRFQYERGSLIDKQIRAARKAIVESHVVTEDTKLETQDDARV